jgi:outer membrane protein TolC
MELLKFRPVYVLCTGMTILSGMAVAQEPVSFRKAVELALSQSTEIALSSADETRAYQTYREAHNSYVPKVAIGSDIGYAYGFPLSLEGSAPTLFNVNAQSPVWNSAQKDFTRATKTDWSATKAQVKDQRTQIVMDTALTYLELNRWESTLPVLTSELNVADNIESSTAERVKEGIDKPVDRVKAELIVAQVQMHLTQAEGLVDILRTRLSQLTGLPASSIRTVRESIPILKEHQKDNADSAVQTSNPALEANELSALAKQLRAKGEHRMLYPTADFAAQYGLINTSLTNFEQFFVPHSFQPHNVTFGLVLRLPFLDSSQRARAAAADAEALRARKEVEQTKNKLALDSLKLQHNVEQLKAARRIADLRYQLAANELDAANARLEAETATQRELQNAAVNTAERSLDRINADFEVQRAEIELLRTRGELEAWALDERR